MTHTPETTNDAPGKESVVVVGDLSMKENTDAPKTEAPPQARVTVQRIVREWAEADGVPAAVDEVDRILQDAFRRMRGRAA